MATRILLADTHLMVREGVRRILEQHEGFSVVSEVSDGVDALRKIEGQRPDVAVLEFTLPRLSGVEVIRQVARRCSTRCLILSNGHTQNGIREVLRSGAAGYLLKSAPASQLLEAIETVQQGKFYFSPDVATHVVQAATSHNSFGGYDLCRLTGREREVLQLVAEGMSTKEIGTSLGVSTRTADSHRARLMNKLGIHKVAPLVRLAIREGLVEA